MVLAKKKYSGLEVRKWVEQSLTSLLLLEGKGDITSPALCDEDGFMIEKWRLNGEYHAVMLRLQNLHPTLISKDVEVGKKFNVYPLIGRNDKSCINATLAIVILVLRICYHSTFTRYTPTTYKLQLSWYLVLLYYWHIMSVNMLKLNSNTRYRAIYNVNWITLNIVHMNMGVLKLLQWIAIIYARWYLATSNFRSYWSNL